ncbi:GNAT family N-acetyltransferase [Bryobacter aggregatus]|uniref:GNAT family N-acetyltransferase n=1 Tax=Bryobacter aggregatus TaxID=360054 RepID=UPI0004E1EC5E|nr:GNAT family N-acetyltransferase [Bryobacter aggregatus]
MSDTKIERLSSPGADFLELLEEYYDAIQVVQRDSEAQTEALFREPGNGVWVALLDGKAVGCVVLRAGECKRLYVQEAARGRGIADQLMQALEDFAREQGLEWLYLDSHDGLQAAIALYRRRGYLDCERYNDNPQATIFLRKRLGTGGISE